jgi:probable HAF family extracellular repeat protein
MTTPQQILESHTDKIWIRFITRKVSYSLTILIACCGAALAQAQAEPQQYHVSNLDALGGTNSRGNSINNRSWVAGYSNLTGDQSRHATLWRNGSDGSVVNLGTLGGPNSSVTWNVKNNRGIIVGISQTATPEPLGENWSSFAFYPPPNNIGYINLGFIWEHGKMRGLPTFPGGHNGFATGANNRGQVVGWAENGVHDVTCVPPQVLQFLPAVWSDSNQDKIHALPLISGDTSGAATAINDSGQAVGISGICDQAVGRHTAKHAVLWQNGKVFDIGDLGAEFWNTPTAINQRGDVAGFAGTPGDPDGNVLHAFIWTKRDGIRALGELPGHVYSEASDINERRQVVGVSCDADFADCRAFIWDNGVMTDLNTLKAPGYPARLDNAKSINDRGEITGRATDSVTGKRTAFLAVPVH